MNIHLLEPGEKEGHLLARPVTPEDVEARKPDGSVARLFDLFKLGRNERVFRAALPHLYLDVESRKVEFLSDDDRVATIVTDVHRFPEEDAIFLGGRIENHTDEVQYFDPGALEVGVGERGYPVALADAPAEVPAGGTVPAHILLRGGANGERAHLSVKNEFRLLMPEYTARPDDPSLTGAEGLVIEPPANNPLFGRPDDSLEGGGK